MEKEVFETEVEIKNSDGLHMRPALQFVDVANSFKYTITVSNDKDIADAKSIMQMTVLAASCGTKLKIKAEGNDAKEAIETLRELVEEELFDKSSQQEQQKG